MTEEDPTFLSDEENEAIFHEREKTPQIPKAEAIRRVIGNERAARLLEAEAATKRLASVKARPTRPYRARFQDSTDESVSAFREGTENRNEVSDEEVAAGRESHDFIQRAFEETGSFDLSQYLHNHPEQIEEARGLGLIE